MCTHIRLFICVDSSAFVVLVDFKLYVNLSICVFQIFEEICTHSKTRHFWLCCSCVDFENIQ